METRVAPLRAPASEPGVRQYESRRYRQTTNFNQPSQMSDHAWTNTLARRFPRQAASTPNSTPSPEMTTTFFQPLRATE